MSVKEEERINDTLQELLDTHEIDETLFEDMKLMGGQLPRLYGLAKVHKPNVPIRSVLSMPGLPYWKKRKKYIAEKVTKWLSMVPESKINCSTKKAVNQLKDVTLDPEEVTISFDVSSLYTNVLVKEAIEEAADHLYSGDFPTPPVSKEINLQSFQLPKLFYQLMMAYIDKLTARPWDLNQHHHSQTSGYPNLNPT